MQSWAKRGLQTALVTSGLLMLGTGIASADEQVNPDIPASPLDANVTVPLEIDNNAVGTPPGQANLPGYKGEVSTKTVTKPVSDALHSASSPGSGTNGIGGGLPSLPGKGAVPAPLARNDSPRQVSGGLTPGGFTTTDDILKGNKVVGDVVVPIQIVDNAIGVLGDAEVKGGSHQQTWSHNQDVKTTGEDSSLAGNVVSLDWALPVQIAGNGGGLAGGTGRVVGGSAGQSTTETGNITTDGEGSALSGNVVAGQFATPVQVTGNAASWIIGNADSSGYEAETDATSGGWVQTDGDDSSLGGNAGAVPIALPVKVNDNAAAAWGSLANSNSSSAADATAGDTTPGWSNVPTYVQTSGEDSFLAGNAIVPQTADVANVGGVAASWIGLANTGKDGGTSQSSAVDAGGFVSSEGEGATGGGNIVDPAVAAPAEVTCIAGTYIGNSTATSCENTVDANAGNGSHTTGDDSTLAGNIVNTQAALAPEVYGVGASHIGQAAAEATETKTVTAGGYDGTTGDDSSGSGNIVQVPAAVPAEVFGVGGSFIGQGSGSADETKVVSGGGGGNTADDNGFLSSNLATTPASLPVQLFGIGAAFIGQGHGAADGDTTSNAGGDVHATGDGGAGAGNLVYGPVSLPVQGHNFAAVLGGIASGKGTNLTDSSAGGDATANGADGALAGNIVQTPVGGAVPVTGLGVAGAGIAKGDSVSDVMSEAGGDATTNGDNGAVAGNIIGAQALPITPVTHDAVAAAGLADAEGSNTVDALSGGDVETSGLDGSLSGNILDIPAAADPEVFGDAIAAVGGASKTNAESVIDGQAGGDSITDGNGEALSGFNLHRPFIFVIPVNEFEMPVLAVADENSTDDTEVNDEDYTRAFTDSVGSEMPIDALPTLPFGALAVPSLNGAGALPTTPAIGGARADGPQLGGLTAGLTALKQVGAIPAQLPKSALPALPGTPALPGVSALPGTSALPGVPALPGTPALPGQGRADAPKISQLPSLPSVTSLPIAGGLPVDLPAVGQLPIGQLPVGQLPAAGKLPVDLPAVGQLPIGQLPVGQLPAAGKLLVGQLPVGQLPVGQLPAAGKLPVGQLPAAGKLPVGQLPAAGKLPVQLPTEGKLPVQLPTAGTLPVVNSTPAMPTAQVPALAGVDSSPLSMFQRFLGTLTGKKFHTM
ncbi:PE-PGRS family protein [Amycolatopsis sp. NPDC051071]|uniref:beta strand repeat-containing protein n=1 Tax=Amycolatopsis sp. NPDC051071 TaxID=3154637 RepID=UPI00342F6CD2